MTTTQTQFLSELKALLRKHKVDLHSVGHGESEIQASFEDGDYLNLGYSMKHDGERGIRFGHGSGLVYAGDIGSCS